MSCRKWATCVCGAICTHHFSLGVFLPIQMEIGGGLQVEETVGNKREETKPD